MAQETAPWTPAWAQWQAALQILISWVLMTRPCFSGKLTGWGRNLACPQKRGAGQSPPRLRALGRCPTAAACQRQCGWHDGPWFRRLCELSSGQSLAEASWCRGNARSCLGVPLVSPWQGLLSWHHTRGRRITRAPQSAQVSADGVPPQVPPHCCWLPARPPGGWCCPVCTHFP